MAPSEGRRATVEVEEVLGMFNWSSVGYELWIDWPWYINCVLLSSSTNKKFDHSVSSLYQVFHCCFALAADMDATLRTSRHARGGQRGPRRWR